MTITDDELTDALRRLPLEPSSEAFWDDLRARLADDRGDGDDGDDDGMIESAGPLPGGRSARWRWLAAAGAVVLIVAAAAMVAAHGPTRPSRPAHRPPGVLHDPLSIDLDPWVDPNLHWPPEARRTYLSFDFGDLPDGWQVNSEYGQTMPGVPSGQYWWNASLGSADDGAVLVIVSSIGTGRAPTEPGADTVDIDGQPAQLRGDGLAWQTADGISVDVSGIGTTVDTVIELARSMRPVEGPTLPLRDPNAGTPPMPDDAVLAGQLGGASWSAKQTPIGTLLVRAGGTVETTAAEVEHSVIVLAIPGLGVLVAGDGPSAMRSVRVELSDGTTVTVPAVPSGAHAWFAVPIPARLDAVALVPVDAAGDALGRTALPTFPPYLNAVSVHDGVLGTVDLAGPDLNAVG